MERRNILSIGRDSSIAEPGSQLHERFQQYDSYHTFTVVVVNKGKRIETTIGQSTIILTGGKTLLGAFLNGLTEAFKQAKKNQYAVVTTQDVLYSGLIGFIVGKLFNLPFYAQVHGDHLDNERWFRSEVGKFNRIMNVVGKFLLKRADNVRVVSDRLKEQLISNYHLDEKKLISIPIGTDLQKFTAVEERVRERRIFFAQRLIHEKCPMLFAEVVKEVIVEFPDVTVGIAGDGFLRGDMETYFTEHNLSSKVTFYGQLSQTELAKLYNTSHCYIHTADWEGWGMPMIESIAAGCPVVTTDTGCAGEAIRHEETGLVTAINDKDALVRETKRLFADRELWEQLVAAGRREALIWSFSSLTEKNMEWYGNATKN